MTFEALRGWERNENRKGRAFSWNGAFGSQYFFVCDPIFMEAHQKYCALTEPIKIKHAYEIWEVEQKHFNSLIQQGRFANRIAQGSPIVLYDNLMSALAGTDLKNSEVFIKDTIAYRKEIIRYIRLKTENFSSPSYFTTCKDGDWDEYVEVPDQRIKKWIEKKREMSPSLGVQNFPKFIHRTPNILSSVKTILPDLALLVFVGALFFVLCFVAFLRYDAK